MGNLQKKENISAIFFFLIPASIWLVNLLSFWPGILSFDSIYQWAQVYNNSFNDWHPIFHTFLIWLFSRIWFTPAAVLIAQIVYFSGVVAYGLVTFHRMGVPVWLLLLVDFLFSISIINSFMAITLWKDVPYSISILLLSIFLIKIITTRGDWLDKKINLLLLSALIAVISLLRHNGFPVVFGTVIVCLFLFWNKRKEFLIALAFGLILMLGVKESLVKTLKIDIKNNLPTAFLLVHPISAYVQAGSSFNPGEEQLLNRLYPLEKGWNYNCYDATLFFYKGVLFEPIRRNQDFLVKIFLKLVKSDPRIALKHYQCLSSFVWQYNQPEGIYLETIILSNYDASRKKQFLVVEEYVRENSIFPDLKELIKNEAEKSLALDPNMILWRPAIYQTVLGLSVLFIAIRKRDWRFLVILIPVVIQAGILMVTAQLQALRYMYPVYIIGGLFSIPLLYLAIMLQSSASLDHSKRVSTQPEVENA